MKPLRVISLVVGSLLAIPADTERTTRGPVAIGDRPGSRPVGGVGWNLWRAVVGVAYLAAAGFNAGYTLPRSDELDGYADGAWFGFLEDFMNDVFMPNGEVFMSLVIVFEVVVGLLILARRTAVDVGVVASVLWVLVVLPFLAWPYLLTNLVLAGLQGVVLLRRYDRTMPDLLATGVRRGRGAGGQQ